MPEQPKAKQKLINHNFIKTDDFMTAYSNNVQMQPTEWDIRFTFGELDITGDKVTIEQHTAVTMSWAQARIMNHFLEVNMAVYEAQFGKIKIPDTVLPVLGAAPSAEDIEKNPSAKATYELLAKMRQEFLDSLK